ncbi:MAG: monofunctional biosynthetic peptidoglycan transglycosylase [Proteobacteria bacterium]|nr:monofunctional biosynthetic peptidoglycan transglycosylase [Pseudomonadota bacterium]
MIRRLLRLALTTALAAVLLSVLAVLLLRFVNPWTSAFMVDARIASWFDDDPRPWRLQHTWRDYGQISRQLPLAVVASEDQRFPTHRGFDMKQIRMAMDEAQRGRRARGASTISQQVAKNLFLWNGRSWVRKGLEAWFTLLIETLWPKQRILEVYVNIAQFGRGIYGAEAAAQAFYRKPASRLTREQAARLAAVLPNPVRMRADRPSTYVQRRQREIAGQMAALGGTSYLAGL